MAYQIISLTNKNLCKFCFVGLYCWFMTNWKCILINHSAKYQSHSVCFWWKKKQNNLTTSVPGERRDFVLFFSKFLFLLLSVYWIRFTGIFYAAPFRCNGASSFPWNEREIVLLDNVLLLLQKNGNIQEMVKNSIKCLVTSRVSCKDTQCSCYYK